MVLKDRKCVVPVKGILEIEATLVYSNVQDFFALKFSVVFLLDDSS